MLSMYHGRKVRNCYIAFEKLDKNLPVIADISEDQTIPKFSGNLIYTTHANNMNEPEERTIHSITSKHPSLAKRKIVSDFRYLFIDRRIFRQIDLPFFDRTALNLYYQLKWLGMSDISAYGLDSGLVTVERIPLTIPSDSVAQIIMKRH